jgi:DNA-binding transcriptional LysR family regulator
MLGQLASADLHALRVFEAVAEAGSYAAAQDTLNVGASTISMQISNLETRLGCRLCERGRRGFLLTARGAAILEHYRGLKQAMTEFRDEVNALSGRLVGVLHLGMLDATYTESELTVSDLLRDFLSRNPEVHINLTIGSQGELRRAVVGGQLDVAVSTPGRESKWLEVHPLYGEGQGVFCARDHPFFARDPAALSLKDIEAAAWVERGYAASEIAIRPIEPLEIHATASHMEAVAALILSGRYIGYLPLHFAEIWVRRQAMRALLPESLTYEVPIAAVTRAGGRKRLVLEAFLATLREAAGR